MTETIALNPKNIGDEPFEVPILETFYHKGIKLCVHRTWIDGDTPELGKPDEYTVTDFESKLAVTRICVSIEHAKDRAVANIDENCKTAEEFRDFANRQIKARDIALNTLNE